jgi:hypothetical protein
MSRAEWVKPETAEEAAWFARGCSERARLLVVEANGLQMQAARLEALADEYDDRAQELAAAWGLVEAEIETARQPASIRERSA